LVAEQLGLAIAGTLATFTRLITRRRTADISHGGKPVKHTTPNQRECVVKVVIVLWANGMHGNERQHWLIKQATNDFS
jgi:hypothetical protein